MAADAQAVAHAATQQVVTAAEERHRAEQEELAAEKAQVTAATASLVDLVESVANA